MPDQDELVAPPTTFAVPTWSRPFSFLARNIKGWNFVLALPFLALAITAASLPPVFLYEGCESANWRDDTAMLGCLNRNAALLGLGEAVAFLVVASFFVILSAGFGWVGHRGRLRRLRLGYEQRLQRVRDHVITGSASPETFDEVQRLWKPIVRGEHPAVRARAGTSTAIVFNVFASLALGVGLTIYAIGAIASAIDEGDSNAMREFQIMWNGVFIPLLLGFATVVLWGWIQFPRSHAHAVQGSEEAIEMMERSEVRIMAGVQPTRRSRASVVTEGPRFAAYSERARGQ